MRPKRKCNHQALEEKGRGGREEIQVEREGKEGTAIERKGNFGINIGPPTLGKRICISKTVKKEGKSIRKLRLCQRGRGRKGEEKATSRGNKIKRGGTNGA